MDDDEENIDSITTSIASGLGPDIISLDRLMVSEAAAKNILANLKESDEHLENLAPNYVKSAFDEIRYGNGIYGVPTVTDVRALYYRKDILKQNGINLSEFEPHKGPLKISTLDEKISKLNVLKSGEYQSIGFVPWFEQGWHYTWGFAFGGEFYDSSKKSVTPESPRVVEAFRYLQKSAQKLDFQKVERAINSWYPPHAEPAKHPFMTGKIPIVVNGSWFVEEVSIHLNRDQWGVTYIPSVEGNKASWSGGFALVINRYSNYKQEALDFIKFAAGPIGQKIIVKNSAELPTHLGVSSDTAFDKERFGFLESLRKESLSRPAIPVGAKYWQSLTDGMFSVMKEKESVEKALGKVKKEIQPILNSLQ